MYKIIKDNKVIDVVRYPKFIRFLSSGHIAITDKTSAQGLVGRDDQTVYSFLTTGLANNELISIQEISLEEFNRIHALLENKQEIVADESELEKAKLTKIRSLSTTCKNKIFNGFTLQLSNGELYNFRLTTEDQLNLMMLENQLNSGETSFIYHATNEPCRIFKKEDMIRIIKTFRDYTLYHTTYFNMAKYYIKSLTNIEKINLFTYGTDISETISDPIFKQILLNGGAF